MEQIRFKTGSGTEYHIKDIKDISSYFKFEGQISRISNTGIHHIKIDGPVENTDDYFMVLFNNYPQIGSSFVYVHELWDGCVTTVVSEIIND